jgi:hypothetical protein
VEPERWGIGLVFDAYYHSIYGLERMALFDTMILESIAAIYDKG